LHYTVKLLIMTRYLIPIATLLLAAACNNDKTTVDKGTADSMDKLQHATTNTGLALPEPYATSSETKRSEVIGWPADKTPTAPSGFTVTRFADNLQSPRWIYVAGNGDVFVAQADREGKKGNNILLFRDTNGDGTPDIKKVYLSGLKQPFGMLIQNSKFYVANTDALVQYPYELNATSITARGKSIASFPTGRHWTRNVIANASGSKLYIAIGSGSNVAENGMDKENRRACILEINADGSGERLYASGLRNPVGMAWNGNELWTAVNERDELGDDLVPDYLTSVQEGGFYGWPYSYFGQHEDPRIRDADKKPELVKKAIVPDVALGSHTAALGLLFYDGTNFPAAYKNGAFVAEHGSWNRSHFAGYKIVFVPFKGGKPAGDPQDFLTGFIANEEKNEVHGRPVGIALLPDGSMLVADDGAGVIWRVAAK
jgi:glucose/arabinose dehydrogenase